MINFEKYFRGVTIEYCGEVLWYCLDNNLLLYEEDDKMVLYGTMSPRVDENKCRNVIRESELDETIRWMVESVGIIVKSLN